MAQLSTRVKKTAKKTTKATPNITTNKAGGVAFDFTDPSQYLLATIGSAMFTEPSYYGDTESAEEIKIAGYNTAGLDEQAAKIVNACIEIAGGKNPRDVLALARWARTELHMRTTPCVMMAVAAQCQGTKQFVRKYIPMVTQRPDDILQIEAAFEHLFRQRKIGKSGNGKKTEKTYPTPACLKRGLADAISKVDEYGFMKYNPEGHPSWKDLLCYVHRKANFPVSKEVFEFLVNGKILDAEKTPIFAARKKLTMLKTWTDEVPELAKQAQVTWEVLVSQFGNDKKVWEAVIPMMGYMALLRNLGNFLSADIGLKAVKQIAEKLSDKDAVLHSKQLPFRYLSAYRTLLPENPVGYYGAGREAVGRDRGSWKTEKVKIFVDAVEAALDCATENVPMLPGVSCIAADNSGSMSSPLSAKSVVSIRDVANVMCSIIHKRSKDSHVAAFGDNAVWPPLSKRDSILTNANKVATYKDSYRGHSTHGHKVIDHLIKEKIKVDRIILLSDMQCYGTNAWGGHQDSVHESLTKYRRLINKDCYLHSFDLHGYGTAQVPPDNLTNVVAGFSEQIFKQILMFEGAESADGAKPLPTLDYIRENY